MRRNSALSCLLALSLLSAPTIASAQGKGGGKTADPAAAAKEKSGRDLLAKGDYDGAISDLLSAYELSNKAELLYLVAKAYDKKGDDPVGAKTYYEQYLSATGGNPPELAEIQGRLSSIDAELATRRAAQGQAQNGKLLLEVEQGGAVVEIEDKPIGKTPLPGALSYPAGSYTVRITKDGYQEYLAVLDVESNDTNKVQISLEKEGKTRWGLWTGLLVGAVAAGTGTTIFLLNQGEAGGANAVPEGDLGINRF
jgi:hypothetical protein